MTARQVKVTNVGDTLTLVIHIAGKVPVGKYPEAQFVGADGATGELLDLRMPLSSAERQLARCKLTLATCAGETLRFGRDPNPSDASKPYYAIELADATPGKPVTRPAQGDVEAVAGAAYAEGAPHPAERATGQPESKGAIYKAITKWVLKEIIPLYTEAGREVESATVAAIVATVYIEANKR